MYLTKKIVSKPFRKVICLILFVLSFCAFFSSCSLVPDELKSVEQLMQIDPDSALHILQKITPTQFTHPSNRALYGLMLFQVLDKMDKPLQPDSVIDFSINYYLNQHDNIQLGKGYFYKARVKKKNQQFDKAVALYIQSLDLLNTTNEYTVLGRIYSDMGDICILQKDFSEALKKIQQSIYYFKKANKKIEVCNRIITIGKIYHFQKNYKRAHYYYEQVLSQTTDSMPVGFAYQEIGINYYWAKQYDSAEYYLRKSLKYPYRGTNKCIRYLHFSDLMYDIGQLDTASRYALLALEYPGTYYNRRDCYRILTNYEYRQNHLEQMGKYMHRYQDYTDSVRSLETQVKTTVLENLHNKNQEVSGVKRNMTWIVSLLTLVLVLTILLVYRLYHRNKLRKNQLDIFKQELNQKREFVTQSISNKIEELRLQQAEIRHNASAQERIRLDKELYEKSLHVGNWEVFECEMNHAFNQIVVRLQLDYSGITQKEICWCCLHLLNIPLADRLLILDATTDSMYKLKQRLAQKMNLKSTRELDAVLKKFVTPQD